MENNLKRTGLFFFLLFILGTIVSVLSGMLGSAHRGFFAALFHPAALITLGCAALFLLSSIFPRLGFLQPSLFFVMMATNMGDLTTLFYGLCFFVIGMVLLFRLNFFERHRVLKLALSLLWLYGWTIFGAIKVKRELIYAFTPVFAMTVFLVFLYIAFHERLVVYLREPKPVLSLDARGLSRAEKAYVLELLGGKQAKEIAQDYELSESTVRNTLARAFKKLEVQGQAEFMALAARHEIKD